MTDFAKHLKILRTKKNLSMQSLADLAKVSKSMISKIEREDVQPTLDVATRLAHALEITLPQLLEASQPKTQVLKRSEQTLLEDEKTGTRKRHLAASHRNQKLEWLEITLKGKKSYSPLPKYLGKENYLLVTKGVLKIRLKENWLELEKGDCLYFEGNDLSEFINPQSELAEYFFLTLNS